MTPAAAVAGQACLHHCRVIQLSGDSFCWLGLLNVLLLVAFLAASLRHDRSGDDGRGERSDQAGDGAPAPLAVRRPAPRASDAEREAATAIVRQAIGEGRLTLDEGVARLDAALAARHRDQLEELVADLPHQADRRPLRWSRVARDLRDFAVIAVAAAAAVQGLTGLWFLWPIAVGALLPLALLGHRLPGRGGEREGGELPSGRGGDSVG